MNVDNAEGLTSAYGTADYTPEKNHGEQTCLSRLINLSSALNSTTNGLKGPR